MLLAFFLRAKRGSLLAKGEIAAITDCSGSARFAIMWVYKRCWAIRIAQGRLADTVDPAS
jgi:hypothetical protein